MRIAYLCNRYPAISHSFVRREIAGVEAAGHRVDRYTVRRPEGLADDADRVEADRTVAILAAGAPALVGAGVAVAVRRPGALLAAARIALKGVAASPAEAVRRIAYLLEACWLLRRFARHPVDHVHAHFGTNPAMVARLLHRLGGPPFSMTVHGPDEFDRPEHFDLAGKVAAARLSAAVSSFGRSQLMRWSDPAHWARIAVVRCGVDAGFLGPVVPPPAAPHFVAVARLAPQKGLPLLIEAAAILKARGVAFRLDIIGDGPLRDSLGDRIRGDGLGEHVHLLGPRDGAGVRAALDAARVFVLPSFAEGLPVVIMEALARGRPVIASAIAGTPELVDAGCGWLIPAGSVQAIADAMADAAAAPVDRIADLGREGRARVERMHDADANARGLVEMLERPC